MARHSSPAGLRGPLKGEDGYVVARVVLNLTVYLHDVTYEDLTGLINLYNRYCPPDRFKLYTIAEWHGWAPINSPIVTDSVAAALAAGDPSPALAPVARRIRQGRGFELRFWDGNEIEEDQGSWSLSCLKVLRRGRDPFCPVSFLLPLKADPALLHEMAREIAASVPIHSGHGGLAFTYQPYRKIDAFEIIYALARRYWGIDVEDLNASARSTGEFLKTISWLTLLGRGLFSAAINRLDGLSEDIDFARHNERLGTVVRVGSVPDEFDVNRPTTDAYYRLARRLEPALPTEHPAFEGTGFGRHDATVRWMRRFADPERLVTLGMKRSNQPRRYHPALLPGSINVWGVARKLLKATRTDAVLLNPVNRENKTLHRRRR